MANQSDVSFEVSKSTNESSNWSDKFDFVHLSSENLAEVVQFLREHYIPDEPVSRVLLAESVQSSSWIGQKLLELMIAPLLEPPCQSIGAR